MLFVNALLFCDDGVFRAGGLRTEGEKIVETGLLSPLPGEEVIDCGGKKLLPGFVDIHTHGRCGGDFSGLTGEDYGRMARSYAAAGITSLLAATMTLPLQELEQAYGALGELLGQRPQGGSRVLGVNMEGPFLSEAKRGAHDRRYLLPPDMSLLVRLNNLCGGRIKLCDLAPELPGAMAFIPQAAGLCRVSVAHTNGDYDTVMAAFAAGASHVTHFFNALSPLGHRAPGAVGAAFDSTACVELICDGVHVHPALLRMVFRLLGWERVCLISDSMSAAGLGDGSYTLGGQAVTVAGGKALLADGTIAGSVTDVAAAVRFCVNCGIPQGDAIRSATTVPARQAGASHLVGSLAPGHLADLLIVRDDLVVEKVFVGGQAV